MIDSIILKQPEGTYLKDPQGSDLGIKIIKESIELMEEIGIEDFIRSMDSRPGKVFGSLRREDAPSYEFYDPNFNVETVPKPAMPTNAWYQSLLVGSVNDGHLGIANRVYTIRECNCICFTF